LDIFLSRFPHQYKDVRDSIFSLNETIVDSGLAGRLLQFLCPKPPKSDDEPEVKPIDYALKTDEFDKIIEYLKTDDEDERIQRLEKLENPDLFIYTLFEVPQIDIRLKTFDIYLNFNERLNTNNAKLETLAIAVADMYKSEHFNKLIEIILAVGNFLNYGHPRLGDTPAFTLTAIYSASILKSKKGTSLLSYIVGFSEEIYPEISNWLQEFKSVKVAYSIDLESFLNVLSEINQDFGNAEKLFGDVKQSDNQNDLFISKMGPRIEEMRSMLNETNQKLEVFQEDSKKF